MAWGPDIGIADGPDVVSGQAAEVVEFGDLGIGADERCADDELGGDIRMLSDQFIDDVAGWIVRAGDSEEDLHGAWIILGEPAPEAVLGCGIGSLHRFEQGDTWEWVWGGCGGGVKGKPVGEPGLPEVEEGGQGGP